MYALYTKLLQAYPHLLIEGCAGGGGRFDLGILFYSPQIWVSDDSDAVERLKIQFGTSLGYPLSAMSNHVTKVPNDQVGRTTPLAMRYDVATFGVLGYELDLTQLDQKTLNALRSQIHEYRKNQQLILNGRFEILRPTGDNHNEYAWAVVNQDATEALVGFFRILATPGQTVSDHLKLPFLDDHRRYRIGGQSVPVSGSVLRNIGLSLPVQFNGVNADTASLRGDYQSCLVHLIAV
nr:alpha-galactosidase [Lacticaseibacillus camelliae]